MILYSAISAVFEPKWKPIRMTELMITGYWIPTLSLRTFKGPSRDLLSPLRQHHEPQGDCFFALGPEDLPEEGTATHSSILAWRIPWTEDPGRLQSTGLQRVRHDWSDSACIQTMERTIQTVLESELSVYFNGQPERRNEMIQSVGWSPALPLTSWVTLEV